MGNSRLKCFSIKADFYRNSNDSHDVSQLRNAISSDPGFIERINNSGLTGFVHSTFKRTINIHCNENGELFTKGENELGK
jgi:hypothetical protein